MLTNILLYDGGNSSTELSSSSHMNAQCMREEVMNGDNQDLAKIPKLVFLYKLVQVVIT